MKIAAVNQRDVDGTSSEGLRRIESTKASADDNNSVILHNREC